MLEVWWKIAKKMKDLYTLKDDLKYHEGHATLFKTLFILNLIAIGALLLSGTSERELWVAIIGLFSAVFFGMAWSWELSQISSIKEEIQNR